MPRDNEFRARTSALWAQVVAALKGFGDALLNFANSFLSLIGHTLRFFYYCLAVGPYFRYWSYRAKIRKILRYTTLVAVSLSTLTLAIEISLELTGEGRLLGILAWVKTHAVSAVENSRKVWPRLFAHLPASAYLVTTGILLILGLSVAYLTWHNVDEARKPGYEYHFARTVHSFLLELRAAHQAKQPIPVSGALEFCHFIFVPFGIRSVSLHLPDSDILRIRREHVFPPPGANFSGTRLRLGEGLAGKVFNDPDLHIQYAPRMFYPFNRRYLGWLFPHTLKLRFSRTPVPGSTIVLWEVGDEEINPNSFKFLQDSPIHYLSLLSVPVVSVTPKQLIGVLNLEFTKTDALDRAGIEMALGFALILGGEIATGHMPL